MLRTYPDLLFFMTDNFDSNQLEKSLSDNR